MKAEKKKAEKKKAEKKKAGSDVSASTRIMTGKVRFCFTYVFEPFTSENEEEKPKYRTCILIPKKSKTVAIVKDAIKLALEQGKTSKFDGKIPASYKNPLRDGDEERPDSPEFAGCYFVNASSLNKPGLVDVNREVILDKNDFYAGCYGRCTLTFYPFNFRGAKGIACGLNNIQKLEDGPKLAGGPSAEEDFAN